MDRVAVVGAGVAGAGAATSLDDRTVDVSVFQQCGRVGGRATSRSRGDVVYDIGANYLKSDDPRITTLVTEPLDTDELVDVTDPVYPFDATGTVEPGRDADEHKWSYRTRLDDLSRRLFDRTDAPVSLETRIESCTRPDDWVLEAADGSQRGPFDALVLTPPAPVAARLLGGSRVPEAVVDELAAVEYRTVYSAALHSRSTSNGRITRSSTLTRPTRWAGSRGSPASLGTSPRARRC